MPNREYINGVRQNLIQEFGEENVPDAETFYTKMQDENYVKGVHTNLVQTFGNETPNETTFINKINGTYTEPVKKKEVSQPIAQPAGQTSKTGTSNISQSSYNLDLSLPKVNPNPNNTALPGLGKPLNAKDNILGKGTTVTETPKKPIKENPYFVDVTDKSKDNSTTQADKQAQIQSDINTGKLDENNIATYRGASKLFSDKAVEVTGKNDAQSLIEYGKVAGVDDDLVNRLDDGDKTLFQNQEQLKNLYEQRDILSKSDEQTQKSNITEINKSIAEIEKNNALLYTKRNSDIDAQILDLQKQLNT